MKRRLLVFGMAFLVGCDINGDFKDYCQTTGNCQCNGSDCCSLTTCGEGSLDCCGGSLCQSGQCVSAAATWTLSPTSIDFGHFPGLASTPVVSLQLTNSGLSSGSTYLALSATSGTLSEFVVDAGACPSQLAPGASCAIQVSVVAATLGLKKAQLVATDGKARCTVSAVFGDNVEVTLTGSQIPTIQSSPPGLVCAGSQCAGYFATGTSLSLTVPEPYGVTWAPPCGTSTGVCTFIVMADTQVAATIQPPLVVDITGSGSTPTGVVQVDPGAIVCNGHCELAVTGAVTLSAITFSQNATVFQGWSGACASASGPVCTLNVTAPTQVSVDLVEINSVFLTVPVPLLSFGSDGSGADAICNAAATSGHYVAWLASSGRNPATLLGSASGWSPNPVDFYDPPMARYVSDITSARLWTQMACSDCGNGPIITGANPDGTSLSAADTCQDWTSTSGTAPVGTPYAIGYGWSVDLGASRISCAASASLACFGTTTSGVVLTDDPARLYGSFGITFVSSAWIPSGGPGGADSHCQSDAHAAGLSGTFAASIGSSAMTTFSNFIRSDGALVGAMSSDFSTLNNVDAFGNGIIPGIVSDTYVWTGQASNCANCCDQWTGGASLLGAVTRFDVANIPPAPVPCTEAHRLYCYQVE